MSYVVLARKYRSNNFSEMVGQGHVVQALQNALTSQRLHHAYLFTGTRGVGKTTVSRILAKSLNCVGADGKGGITAMPCGVCHACRDITEGRFVDYTELDAASNRGVDEIQALLEQAVYKPVIGRFKVFMIDEVHMLSNTAFNAMLKTLEEPPEYLKFILATTDPKKVPVTVLSRCLQFNLRPMAPETVADHLTDVLGQEGVPAEAMAIKLLSRAARGSMRDALSLADQAIAFGDGQLLANQVQQMLGSADRGMVFRLLAALAAADGAQVFACVEALRTNGLSAVAALEDLVTVLQRMSVVQLAGVALADDEPEIATLAQQMPVDETQLLYSMCLHGRAELGLAPDEYSGLTMVLLRLLAFKPGGSVPGISPLEGKKPTPQGSGHVAVGGAAEPPKKPDREPLSQVAAPPELPKTANGDVQEVVSAENSAFVQYPSHFIATNSVAIEVLQPRHDVSDGAAAPVQASASPEAAHALAVANAPESTLLGDFWASLVAELCAKDLISALPRELALQSTLHSQSGEGAGAVWQLVVGAEALMQPATRERLQAALHVLGHPVRLEAEFGNALGTPKQRLERAAQARQKAAEAIIHADPFVQRMLRDFGGTIVPGSLRPVTATETK